MFYFTGSEHLDLIFDYAGWVLKAFPEDGIKVYSDMLFSQFSVSSYTLWAYQYTDRHIDHVSAFCS